jgi:hypothetical protein
MNNMKLIIDVIESAVTVHDADVNGLQLKKVCALIDQAHKVVKLTYSLD